MTTVSPLRGAGFFRRLGIADWVFLGFLLIVWPGVSWFLFPSGDEAISALTGVSRPLVYLQSIAITASVLLLLVFVLGFRRQSYIDLGFRDLSPANVGLGVLLLIAANAILFLVRTIMPSLGPDPGDFIYLLLTGSALVAV